MSKRNLKRAFAQVLDCLDRGEHWEAEARFGLLGLNLCPSVIDRTAVEEATETHLHGDRPTGWRFG